jgi:hypothetical protein
VWYSSLIRNERKEPRMATYARTGSGYHYVNTATSWATQNQIDYLKKLLTEHQLYDGHYDRLWKLLEVHEVDVRTPGDGTRMTLQQASASIDWVKRQIAKAAGPSWQEASLLTHHPFEARRQAEQAVVTASAEPVTYTERATGGNRQSAGLYPTKPAAPTVSQFGVYRKDGEIYVVKPNKAGNRVYAKQVVESPPRVTEAGEVVDFELVYAPGMVYKLTEADRMPLADGKALMTRYGKCLVCGRHLKAAKSVEAGIGPVCSKNFS